MSGSPFNASATNRQHGFVNAAFFVLYQKRGLESVTQERVCDLGRDYQHRERLGNDDDNTDTPAHFLRILSMAFPLASSSTSLSR